MPQLPVLRYVSLEFIGKSTVVRAQIAEYDKKGEQKHDSLFVTWKTGPRQTTLHIV